MEDSTKVNHFVIEDSSSEEPAPTNEQEPPAKVPEQKPTDQSNPVASIEPQSSPALARPDTLLPNKNTKETGSQETISGVSSCSSPMPAEPFQPRYAVQLLPKAMTRNGEITTYAIQAQRHHDGQKFVVRRQYEDFEYLNHCLTVAAFPGDGLIFPPLPPRPQPQTSEIIMTKTKDKTGVKAFAFDDFQKECYFVQLYLNAMLNHPVFGRSNDTWDKFLAAKDAPPRVKIRKNGFLARLSDSLENRGKGNHRDFDEYFQKEKDWLTNYSQIIKETSDLFTARTLARVKLASVVGHLSTAFTLNIGSYETQSALTRTHHKFCTLFSNGLDNYRKGTEVMQHNDDASLGACLEHWSRMLEAERDMLFRRMCLLVDYEQSNRSLEKAKPMKRDQAEQSKLDAERAFEDCSDVARMELRMFHRSRAAQIGAALEKYGHAQLMVARDLAVIIKSSLDALKAFDANEAN